MRVFSSKLLALAALGLATTAAAPSVARADEVPAEVKGEVAVPGAGAVEPSASPTAEASAPEEAHPLSPLFPRAGSWDGFVAPTFAGDWRARIALNAWLPNELPVTIKEGGRQEDVTLTLSFLLNNLKYYYPVDVEIRKGSFGVFAHTLFWKLANGEKILGGRASANWNDKGYWIDTGLSYELASWKLTDEPGGPAVTLEPFAAARLVRDPVEVTLPITGTTIKGFNSVVPIIGLRTFWDLDEHWNLRVEGDYGGFGVDDNRRTWQAVGLIGYRWRGWGTSWNLQVGYRATTLFKLNVPGGTVRQEARGTNIVFSVEL
jgi:hypothetical protein